MGNELTAFAGGWEAHRHHHCIWIVSPPGYLHSHAFDEVAEGLSEAFSELGGSAPIARHPSEWHGRSPIVLGGNLLQHMPLDIPPSSIILNLEQVVPGSDWLGSGYLALLKHHPVLDYSVQNHDQLCKAGISHARVLEIGYSPTLTRVPIDAEKDIDVLFYGSMSDRRQIALDHVIAAGLRVEELYDVYGSERDKKLARTKLVLNIHYHENGVFEVVRVSYLLANRVPVVSEGKPDDAEWVLGAVQFAPYHRLAETCMALASDSTHRKELAETGFRRIASRRQSDFLKQCIQSARSSEA